MITTIVSFWFDRLFTIRTFPDCVEWLCSCVFADARKLTTAIELDPPGCQNQGFSHRCGILFVKETNVNHIGFDRDGVCFVWVEVQSRDFASDECSNESGDHPSERLWEFLQNRNGSLWNRKVRPANVVEIRFDHKTKHGDSFVKELLELSETDIISKIMVLS